MGVPYTKKVVRNDQQYCTHCYKILEPGTIICPYCNRVQHSSPQPIQKQKKALYKRWWFWVIVIFLVVGIIGGGDDEAPSSQPTNVTLSQSDIDEILESADLEKETISAPLIIDNTTLGEKNALRSAKNYLDYTAFSYSGLIDQLEFEGYSTEEATYAAKNCGADWNEQALKSAKNYLEYTAFSYSGLIDQLEFEGFSNIEATYGVNNCGANWNEQAARCAESYLRYSGFSRQGLIDQLIFDGFTQAQAEYGVRAVGY